MRTRIVLSQHSWRPAWQFSQRVISSGVSSIHSSKYEFTETSIADLFPTEKTIHVSKKNIAALTYSELLYVVTNIQQYWDDLVKIQASETCVYLILCMPRSKYFRSHLFSFAPAFGKHPRLHTRARGCVYKRYDFCCFQTVSQTFSENNCLHGPWNLNLSQQHHSETNANGQKLTAVFYLKKWPHLRQNCQRTRTPLSSPASKK